MEVAVAENKEQRGKGRVGTLANPETYENVPGHVIPIIERVAEAARQVRGRAGEHQVDGARVALGHAYGGGSQFFAMWVVGADKPEVS